MAPCDRPSAVRRRSAPSWLRCSPSSLSSRPGPMTSPRWSIRSFLQEPAPVDVEPSRASGEGRGDGTQGRGSPASDGRGAGRDPVATMTALVAAELRWGPPG
jgi:hypothetical protein